MKNHIVFKFLAILLCAASLLGAVGCAAGIFVLTEADLYNKTVDEIHKERIQLEGREFAHDLALRYASENLGGCPTEILDAQLGTNLYSIFAHGRYGYALKDADGNVLSSRQSLHPENAVTYVFPAEGQYMHFVSSASESQQQAEQLLQRNEYILSSDGSRANIYDVIPEGGTALSRISFFDNQGNMILETSGNIGAFAFVYHKDNGVVYLKDSSTQSAPNQPGQTVYSAELIGANDQLVYAASGTEGIGVYGFDSSGQLYFESFPIVEQITIVDSTGARDAMPTPTAVTEPAVAETKATEMTEAAPAELPATEGEPAPAEPPAAEAETAPADPPAAEAETAPEETKASKKSKNSKKSSSSGEPAAADTSNEEPAASVAAATEATAAPETVPETTVAETLPPETVPEETVPATEPALINGKPLDQYQINRAEYYDRGLQEPVTVRYVYLPMPEMTVELYLEPGALEYESFYSVLRMVRSVRGYLLPALGISLLMFAICVVYLCCAAGRKPKSDEVRSGGLNRIPLDLYFGLMIGGVAGLAVLGVEGSNYFLRQNTTVGCLFAASMAFLACLLLVGFGFAFVAQIKTPDGFWWRNSLVGWCLKLVALLWRRFITFLVWLKNFTVSRLFPWLVSLCRKIWKLFVSCCVFALNLVKGFFVWLGRQLHRLLSLLPLTWQWLVAGGVMVAFLFITVAGRFDFGMVLAVLFALALILYGAQCFGTLLETTKKMNKGNLDSKVDDRLMVGAFKEFAGDLNDLAGVAVVAAQKQLKSERMKTELITNVSHDIKTPLTSIINYVDLLQKPHTPEEEAQYLEVLDRQSQRLKKLIEDLMDMSKASTGNMAVDITLVDAVESVNQALGEFADKLDRALLTPVFRHTEESVPMMADGRLVWRVLSNLLSNAVKYAMPGTRVYIDLMQAEGKVILSLKNISRDELNIDAEELMERFVRGDEARNTEGSGLGLNIAKSLMELQKGQLQLLVDGDLFKVTLIFPGL